MYLISAPQFRIESMFALLATALRRRIGKISWIFAMSDNEIMLNGSHTYPSGWNRSPRSSIQPGKHDWLASYSPT
jgi:hypothetical protein